MGKNATNIPSAARRAPGKPHYLDKKIYIKLISYTSVL